MSAEPRRCYLVCATQRSGSTLLCQLLSATGVAGAPEEYFEATRGTGRPPHPGSYLDGLPRTGAGIRDDERPPQAPSYSSLEGITDYREHLARTFRLGTTDNGVFGAKLMFNQLPELRALAATLPEFAQAGIEELLGGLFGDARYIHVTREDKVRQAVSLWKALQNRSWRHGAGSPKAELAYRYAGIDHLVRLFEAADEGWEELFHRLEITPLRIGYEADLEARPEWAVRATLRHIGVVAPADWRLPTTLERQADALSEQWVARYDHDRAEHGSPTADRPTASS